MRQEHVDADATPGEHGGPTNVCSMWKEVRSQLIDLAPSNKNPATNLEQDLEKLAWLMKQAVAIVVTLVTMTVPQRSGALRAAQSPVFVAGLLGLHQLKLKFRTLDHAVLAWPRAAPVQLLWRVENSALHVAQSLFQEVLQQCVQIWNASHGWISGNLVGDPTVKVKSREFIRFLSMTPQDQEIIYWCDECLGQIEKSLVEPVTPARAKLLQEEWNSRINYELETTKATLKRRLQNESIETVAILYRSRQSILRSRPRQNTSARSTRRPIPSHSMATLILFLKLSFGCSAGFASTRAISSRERN